MFIFFQSTFEQETKALVKEHRSKEATLLKDKRDLKKQVVHINAIIESNITDIMLLQDKQAYNVTTAIATAKREERQHFASVVKTQKDKGRKLQSTSVICQLIPIVLLLCITFLLRKNQFTHSSV